MPNEDETCSVRDRATETRCTKPTYEVWDDELVGWVNAAWTESGLFIGGNSICIGHLGQTPEV